MRRRDRNTDVVAAGGNRGGGCASDCRGQRSRLQRTQDHPLDVRVNVKGGRAQKTYERLVAVARELDRKT